jgi:hypothetical protein
MALKDVLSQLVAAAEKMCQSEYGSEEQIDADNEFVELAQTLMTEEQCDAWNEYALKATTEERALYGLEQLINNCMRRPGPIEELTQLQKVRTCIEFFKDEGCTDQSEWSKHG